MSRPSNFKQVKLDIISQSETLIPKIANYFNLGKIKTNPAILSGGVANINYFINTENGAYVVKILLSSKRSQVGNEVLIQKQLLENGISCPEYIENFDKKFIYFKSGVCAVVSKFIEGDICKKTNRQFCFNMGRTLALFHKSVIKLKHPNKGWLNKDYLKHTGINPTKRNQLLLFKLLKLRQTSSDILYKMDLPTGIIHGDLYEGNILLGHDNVCTVKAIFDFEHAEKNILIIDLARTILSIAEVDNKLKSEFMNETINGYCTIRSLSNLELKYLPTAIKYVAGTGGLWLLSHDEIKLANNYLLKAISI